MPFQDFREFLDALQKAGELLEVDRAVSPELEVAKAMKKRASFPDRQSSSRTTGPRSHWLAVSTAPHLKALIALQTTENDVFDRVLQGMSARIPPIVAADGPLHENIIMENDVDLSKLPIAKYSPDDGGAYITAGVVASKVPTRAFRTSGIIASKSSTSRP